MFKTRKIQSNNSWFDESKTKIYTISIDDNAVDQSKFISRLNKVKKSRDIDWNNIASFVIFHKGESCNYLVFVWWGNDNELFTSVSVEVDDVWVEDPSKYSFCLYDMEVMWMERNIYIETIDCDSPSLDLYRQSRGIRDNG